MLSCLSLLASSVLGAGRQPGASPDWPRRAPNMGITECFTSTSLVSHVLHFSNGNITLSTLRSVAAKWTSEATGSKAVHMPRTVSQIAPRFLHTCCRRRVEQHKGSSRHGIIAAHICSAPSINSPSVSTTSSDFALFTIIKVFQSPCVGPDLRVFTSRE